MAILKSVPTDFGADANYWNIGARSEDFRGGGVEITLYGFVSEDARRANKQPISKAVVTYTGEDYKPDETRDQLYERVKKDVSFLGSKDA